MAIFYIHSDNQIVGKGPQQIHYRQNFPVPDRLCCGLLIHRKEPGTC